MSPWLSDERGRGRRHARRSRRCCARPPAPGRPGRAGRQSVSSASDRDGGAGEPADRRRRCGDRSTAASEPGTAGAPPEPGGHGRPPASSTGRDQRTVGGRREPARRSARSATESGIDWIRHETRDADGSGRRSDREARASSAARCTAASASTSPRQRVRPLGRRQPSATGGGPRLGCRRGLGRRRLRHARRRRGQRSRRSAVGGAAPGRRGDGRRRAAELDARRWSRRDHGAPPLSSFAAGRPRPRAGSRGFSVTAARDTGRRASTVGPGQPSSSPSKIDSPGTTGCEVVGFVTWSQVSSRSRGTCAAAARPGSRANSGLSRRWRRSSRLSRGPGRLRHAVDGLVVVSGSSATPADTSCSSIAMTGISAPSGRS